MTALQVPMLPGVRGRVVVVLFLLTVAVVLGSVPGWDLCALAWLWLSAPTLALLALISACRLLLDLWRGRRRHALRRGWQLALPLAGILALPMLSRVSQYVELTAVRSQLRASAWARPQDGVPHVASMAMDSFLLMSWGYVYDDSGEIAKPCGTQSDAWQRHADHAGIVDLCPVSVTHLIGPYYEWFYQ